MSNTEKSPEELRDMILSRLKGSPVCPVGMDVRVRPLHQSWTIDCIPPADNHVAYADCCRFAMHVVVELRQTFSLAQKR